MSVKEQTRLPTPYIDYDVHAVLRDNLKTPGQLLVATFMLTRADHTTGHAVVAQDWLSWVAGVHRSTVIRTLKILREAGLAALVTEASPQAKRAAVYDFTPLLSKGKVRSASPQKAKPPAIDYSWHDAVYQSLAEPPDNIVWARAELDKVPLDLRSAVAAELDGKAGLLVSLLGMIDHGRKLAKKPAPYVPGPPVVESPGEQYERQLKARKDLAEAKRRSAAAAQEKLDQANQHAEFLRNNNLNS